MFQLRDSWVWDFWFADDGETYHLFFLYASRALHNPEDRHYRASIGHATSTDLENWTRIEDALVRGDKDEFDDVATWTGSIVQHPDGTWYMFYTGVRRPQRPAHRLRHLGRPDPLDESDRQPHPRRRPALVRGHRRPHLAGRSIPRPLGLPRSGR
jgi:Glycosyl hydrolases family 32 N-terminal domain